MSLFTEDIIVYKENLKGSTKNILDLKSDFGNAVRYNIKIQKLMAFFTPTMNYEKQKLRTNPIYYSNKK